MAYSPPTYRTLVRLSDGGQMGRVNPAPQPGGFLKGLPSPFWCTDSFRWQLLIYVQENEPASLTGCTAVLKARPLNQIAEDVILATAAATEGTPGYYNSFSFFVPRDTFPDLDYSGETMQLYIDIEGDAEDVSASADVRSTIYQTIEFIGPSGTQAETPFAPVPAGRWMGEYDPTYQYGAYDTVSNPDEYGIDCIWMNINSSGSLGVEPLNANSDTWYCIIRDYTGAWMTSISTQLDDKQDAIDVADAFPGSVGNTTKVFLDGQRGTASQVRSYVHAFTPTVAGNWDPPLPDDIAEALDALAARLTDTEASAGAAVTGLDDKQDKIDIVPAFDGPVLDVTKVFLDGQRGTASQVRSYVHAFTPTVAGNWDPPLPDDIAEALDALAARLTDTEASAGAAVTGLDDKQDKIDIVPAFDGPVLDVTKVFMDGLRGTALQIQAYVREFSPGVSADWDPTLPDDTHEALDALAARLRDQEQSPYVFTPASAVTQYKVYYNNGGTWTLADPDLLDCDTVELFFSVGASVAVNGMLSEGLVTNAGWSWTTVGAPLYLDDSGEMTEDVPTILEDSGRVGRIVGWVRDATSVWFDGHIPGGVMDEST
jgi:hypothetical protein